MSALTRKNISLAGILFRREALVFILTLVCSLAIFLLSLRFIFQTMWDEATQAVRVELEKEADTIARLLVFEFSHLTELATQSDPGSATDERISRLLWEKVTFNETIRGIELIRRHADQQGQFLTYSYFPLNRRGSESEEGPQKGWKSFAGPEAELIRLINQEQRVERSLLESINQGRKLESEVLFRYFPLYIPLPDQGAVYWGVTKVGINSDALRRFLVLLENEKSDSRRTLAWIMAGLVAFALALGLLGFKWAGGKTAAPLNDYVLMAEGLQSGAGLDIDSLLTHLQQQETQGIREFDQLQNFSLRLGGTVKSLGERLLAAEGQACAGRLAARLAAKEAGRGLSAWDRLFAPVPAGWREVDLQPLLRQLSNYFVTVLPAGSRLDEEVQPVPPFHGHEAHVVQAFLYLGDFALTELPPGRAGRWQVLPLPTGGVELQLSFPGRFFQEEEMHRLLHPFPARTEALPPLGPWLAAAIAREHGGALEMQPNPGGGLSLRLEIPDNSGGAHG